MVPAGTELKVKRGHFKRGHFKRGHFKRGHFKRGLREIDKATSAKTVKTTVPVTVGTVKNKHKLVFDVPGPWRRYSLFDVTPALLQDIAKTIRAQLSP